MTRSLSRAQREGERLARKKEQKARKAASPPLIRVESAFSDPNLLLIAGPLVQGSWSVPDRLEAALMAASRPIPAPVSGDLLVDTGATTTCISCLAADELGLTPLRYQPNFGANGISQSPVFFARLKLLVPHPVTHIASTIDSEHEAAGIPDLEKSLARLDLNQGGRKVRVIGLLGRDILRYAVLNYDGLAGRYSITFNLPEMLKAPGQRL